MIPHPPDQLGGQRDLGQHVQHVAARTQFFGDQPDVYLGLAAARHAVQQHDVLLGEQLADPLETTLLRRSQFGQAEPDRVAFLADGLPTDGPEQALIRQSPQYGRRSRQQTTRHEFRVVEIGRAGPLQILGHRPVLPPGPRQRIESGMQIRLVADRRMQRDESLLRRRVAPVDRLLNRESSGLEHRRHGRSHHQPERTHIIRGQPVPQP